MWNSSKEVWARLHEEVFRYLGGCPQYVVLDNLKDGVIKIDLYEPELNPVYAAMLAHYGVVADPARVGRERSKPQGHRWECYPAHAEHGAQRTQI